MSHQPLPRSIGEPWAILVDVTRCSGCERCVDACVEANGLDPVQAATDGATARDGLSAERPCTIVPLASGRFARKSCMHCLEPACVAACLVGGITKSENGPVVYDPDVCIGCRYCMLACPFHIPRYQWDRTAPFMSKCSMCVDRMSSGGVPACVAACPNQALELGRRSELLAVGRARIDEEPGRYLPRIWGENAWGGTSLLYLSDVDLGSLGFASAPESTIPSITDPMIHSTPTIGLGVAMTLTGLSWILDRRRRLMGGESHETEEAHHD